MAFMDIFKIRTFKAEIERLKLEVASLNTRIQELLGYEKYAAIPDVDKYVAERQAEANVKIMEAEAIQSTAHEYATKTIADANEEATAIVAAARKKADEVIAKGRDDASKYTSVVKAMKDTLEGYGDEYLKPSYSLLDELAEEFGFSDGGAKLKEARARTKMLVQTNCAAACDYVESNRQQTAISFVVDAFNGKVDSILSKTKNDNYGKLEEQIKDAAILVNANGAAFRNARIVPEYVGARIDELKWGVVVQELKKRQQEEQREIRERMREEERARKEYEKAMKDAQKEQDYYEKAMAKARAEMEKATDEQREKHQAKILELEAKLVEANEKNKRALSMAQQTRSGNVYVISNVGSFGENVYKIGMTRRLEPMDRVRELGDASVPFSFDVHAIVYSEDAPALEKELHKAFMHAQMNKVNPRKEFFKTDLSSIRKLVEQKGHKTIWTIQSAAQEYKETLEIEKRIKEDPLTRIEWERHMIEIDDEDDEELPIAN